MTKPNQPTALILVHSNTGNTAGLAQQAAETLKSLNWKVNNIILDNAHNDLPEKNPDLILVGSPIHFWHLPVPVVRMIRSLPRFDDVPAFVFLSYGTVFDGNAPYTLAKEISRLGAVVVGGASIMAPHSFMTEQGMRLGDTLKEFGKDQPDEKVLENFNKAVINAAEKAKNNTNDFDIKQMRSPKPVLTFLDGLIPISIQRNALPKVQWNEELCTNCKKCISSCTTGSISFVDGKIITDHNTCYRCYQCLWTCESKARSADLTQTSNLLKGLKKVIKNPGSRIFG